LTCAEWIDVDVLVVTNDCKHLSLDAFARAPLYEWCATTDRSFCFSDTDLHTHDSDDELS